MAHDDLAPVPSRQFSRPELEAVIRRAIELQTGETSQGSDGVSEAEVVRIGRELGLEPAAVRRAMAEVRATGAPEERSALDGFVGARAVHASRVIARPAAEIAPLLDRYLHDVECMVPQRRFGERTRYIQDPSIAAALSRFTRGFTRDYRPLGLKQLEVAVSSLDATSCLVELRVDLGTVRGGLVAGVFGSSGVLTAGWAAAVWATAIPDPLMLVGLPVLGGAWLGMRAIHRSISRSSEEKLESFLDRIEHGEIR